MKNRITLLMLFALLATVLFTPGSLIAQEKEMKPAEVVEALYAAIGAKDVDAAVALLDDEAVLTLIPAPPGYDGTFIGKEEIGAWYAGLAATNGRAALSDFVVTGNTVTYHLAFHSDTFTGLGIAPARYDGAAVVHNGLIKSIAVVFTPEFRVTFNAAVAHQANKATIVRYIDNLWNEGDLAIIDEIIAEEFASHTFPIAQGREGMREMVIGFRDAYPDATIVLDEIIMHDNRAFVISHIVGPEGVPDESAAELGIEDILVFDLTDGQITDRWYFAPPVMDTPPDDAPATIAAANETFMALFNEGDAAGLAGLYTEDGQMMPPNGEILQGREALTAFWQSLFDAGFAGVELEIVETEGFGETITEVSTYTLFGADGTVLDHGKYIILWKLVDGEWLIHRDIFNSSMPMPE